MKRGDLRAARPHLCHRGQENLAVRPRTHCPHLVRRLGLAPKPRAGATIVCVQTKPFPPLVPLAPPRRCKGRPNPWDERRDEAPPANGKGRTSPAPWVSSPGCPQGLALAPCKRWSRWRSVPAVLAKAGMSHSCYKIHTSRGSLLVLPSERTLAHDIAKRNHSCWDLGSLKPLSPALPGP